LSSLGGEILNAKPRAATRDKQRNAIAPVAFTAPAFRPSNRKELARRLRAEMLALENAEFIPAG
jgi:hypothetical protein